MKKDFLTEVLTSHKIPFVTGKKDIHLPTIDRVLSINLEDDTVAADSNTWFILAAEIGMDELSGGVAE